MTLQERRGVFATPTEAARGDLCPEPHALVILAGPHAWGQHNGTGPRLLNGVFNNEGRKRNQVRQHSLPPTSCPPSVHYNVHTPALWRATVAALTLLMCCVAKQHRPSQSQNTALGQQPVSAWSISGAPHSQLSKTLFVYFYGIFEHFCVCYHGKHCKWLQGTPVKPAKAPWTALCARILQ